MTSVQNRRPRLSGNKSGGNKRWGQILLLFIFVTTVISCIPRSQVVRPADTGPKKEETVAEEKQAEETVSVTREFHQVALMLPFQLNRSAGNNPSRADVQRAELALDFYQGFKLGLDAQTAKGANFRLEVLDSRDDEREVARLARLESIREAAIVVGPIYPKEIKVFAEASSLDKAHVLQVSPLAATMPSEFNLANLVSITAPIVAHSDALAAHIARVYRTGDVVIFYKTDESASLQFLPAVRAALLRLNRNIAMHEVEDGEALLERVRLNGNNLVVCGSGNRFRLVTILDQLRNVRDVSGHRIQLFGHPNWAKMQFSEEDGLESLQTVISSSYYIDNRSSAIRDFNEWYKSEFQVDPSEFSYKGYDAGYYFGGLLARYGKSYKQHMLDARHEGLHNAIEFEYNPEWGYVNRAIHFLQYRSGRFTRFD